MYQRAWSPLVVPDLGGCMLLQNFVGNELGTLVADSSDMGTDLLYSSHCYCELRNNGKFVISAVFWLLKCF